MDFVKKWWIWLLLALIMVGVFIFDVFFISVKRDAVEQQGAAFKDAMRILQNTANNLSGIPTEKDIQTCQDHITEIRKEGFATVQEWNKASRALNENHDRTSPGSFAFFLNNLDRSLGQKLAHQLGTTMLVGNTKVKVPKWITTSDCYNLVSTSQTFQNMSEIDPYWRKYLIKKVLHEICADTHVELMQTVADKDGKPIEQMLTATLEQLSDLVIGDPVRATHHIDGSRKDGTQPQSMFGADGSNEMVYYDSYPLSFKVVAHPKVLDAFMQNLLNAPKYGMLLAPKRITIKPYPLEQINKEPVSRRNVDLEVIPDTIFIDTSCTYQHEPSVMAELEYTIFRFNIPENAGMESTSPSGS